MTVHLVIGATGAAGRPLTRRLTDAGATVVAAARTREDLDALGEDSGVDARQVDATDVDAVAELVDAVVADHGQLDGAANLAGSVLLKPAHLTSAEEWQETLALNLTSAFALTRAAAKAMHVLGRLGEGDDVASALAWLLDPDNDWVTGQVLGVDGGLGQVRPRLKR